MKEVQDESVKYSVVVTRKAKRELICLPISEIRDQKVLYYVEF